MIGHHAIDLQVQHARQIAMSAEVTVDRPQKIERPPVVGIGSALDIAECFELIDQDPGGLLGDLCLLSQIGEPAALRADPLEDPRLGLGHVPVTRRGERLVDPRTQRPVRQKQQQPDVEFLARAVGGHDTPLH